MFRLPARYVALAAFCLLAVAPSFAQNNNGRISGTVSDSTGSVIPGAKVTVTNQATNVSQTATTNQTGFYVVPDLAVGTFTVTAEAQGFKKLEKKGYELGDRAAITADFKLEVGAI